VYENRREISGESGNDQLIEVSRHSSGGEKGSSPKMSTKAAPKNGWIWNELLSHTSDVRSPSV